MTSMENMAELKEKSGSDEWCAQWITRPVVQPHDWISYQVEVILSVEEGGAAFLFGYRDEGNHCGIELLEPEEDAQQTHVCIYRVEEDVRQVLGRWFYLHCTHFLHVYHSR
ncbi:hypothetical protein P9222_21160 [Paenibacillus amylolyticus]|nr:hypothetical protein [Paenibacillus amylolyticus]WFR61015.1 hypothetical protein P9222_21160 [Paenibacillus amylolyticus]